MGGGGGLCAMCTVEHVCCVVWHGLSFLQSLMGGTECGGPKATCGLCKQVQITRVSPTHLCNLVGPEPLLYWRHHLLLQGVAH